MAATDQHRLLQTLLRNDFLSFAQRAYRHLNGGAPCDPNWHHEAVVWALHEALHGPDHRLVVTLPPRSLKSFLISIAWPAWLLGQDPTLDIVCISHNAALAEDLGRKCRALITAPWYRLLFPGTRISERSAVHDFKTTRGGGRHSTSVGAGITGFGGKIVIMDDVLRSDDAYSDAGRQSAIDTFARTIRSRLDDKQSGVMILVMQRLHEGDLAGHLLKNGWAQLRLPAIATEDQRIRLGPNLWRERREGEALHPTRESVELLLAMKKEVGTHVFEAQYQQRPVPEHGNYVHARSLKRYAVVPELAGGQIVQSWDTGSKTGTRNDPSVCITTWLYRNQVYVLDVFRDRIEFPDLYRTCVALARRWNASTILIEDAASGQQLLQELRFRQPAGVPTPLAIRPTQSKEARFSGQCNRFENGEVLLPQDAPWLGDLIHELIGFPNTVHDDQVDAIAQLLSWSRRRRADSIGAPPIIVSAWSGSPSWRGGHGGEEEDAGVFGQEDEDELGDHWDRDYPPGFFDVR